MSSGQRGDEGNSERKALSRRDLLGVAAGAAAALTLGGGMLEDAMARAAEPDATSDAKVAIPRNRRALMAYSARTMLMNDKTKYPTLPSGLREVIDFAATVGYSGIEFFSFSGGPSFSQTPSAEGGASPSAKQVRAWLDAAGIKAIGHYNASIANGGAVGLTAATIDAALEMAGILGQPQTGSHDATNASQQKDEVDKAIESWNAMAIKASRAGIPIYSHSHQIPWSFLLDAGPRDAKGFTRSSGIRVMDYFLKHTDAKWVKCEFDLFWAHVAQHQFHSYTAADGSTVEAAFDPAKQVASDPSRYVILHAKDGIRAPKTPEGYVICPFGYGDLDVERFVRESKVDGAGAWWCSEQDNADGGDTDPQKALRDIANGYRGLATVGQPGGVGAPFRGVPRRAS
jgi:sugar phosphate isomerase/epimerase